MNTDPLRPIAFVQPDHLNSPDNITALLDEIERLRAENAALAADARRWRRLRHEHQIIDPLCAVVWKKNGDRSGSEWVNTTDLDADMDAAMAAEQSDERREG